MIGARFKALLRRLGLLFGRPELDRDLDDELRFQAMRVDPVAALRWE